MPRLTEYLLKLATDAAALDEFRKHRNGKDLPSYLVKTPGPGLSREQAEVLESGDHRRLQDAVQDELRAEGLHTERDEQPLAVTFSCAVNRIQGGG